MQEKENIPFIIEHGSKFSPFPSDRDDKEFSPEMEQKSDEMESLCCHEVLSAKYTLNTDIAEL